MESTTPVENIPVESATPMENTTPIENITPMENTAEQSTTPVETTSMESTLIDSTPVETTPVESTTRMETTPFNLNVTTLETTTQPQCTNVLWTGDGYCDDINNNIVCEWDGGDCCGEDIIDDYCFECSCLEIGNEYFCTTDNPCGENVGDCDFANECEDGLKCGVDNCEVSLLFNSSVDCCYNRSHINDFLNNGDLGYCTINYPCEENEGDCDDDSQCMGYLECGIDNCPSYLGFSSTTDCCTSGIAERGCTKSISKSYKRWYWLLCEIRSGAKSVKIGTKFLFSKKLFKFAHQNLGNLPIKIWET